MMYAPNTDEHWSEIRRLYSGIAAGIERASANRFVVDPHFWCGTAIELSPIERMIWDEARSVGLVLYPQYPIGKFFADFANPAARVVIECDGAEFHRDGAADNRREDALRSLGWDVYRITGVCCHAGMHAAGNEIPWIDRLFDMICADHPEMATPEIASRAIAARREFQQ